MGKRLSFGTGSVRVVMDATLDDIYRRSIERVAPGILGVIESAIDDLHADAVAKWPVKTGRSKAALQALTVVSPDHASVRGTITNNVKYARYIMAKNLGGKNAFVELLRKPLRARAAELATVLGRVTTDALKGR